MLTRREHMTVPQAHCTSIQYNVQCLRLHDHTLFYYCCYSNRFGLLGYSEKENILLEHIKTLQLCTDHFVATV